MTTVMNLPEPGPDVIRMEFTGEAKGAVTYGGNGATPSGRQYRGGANAMDKYIDALPEDVDWLIRTGKFSVVSRRNLVPQEAPNAAEIVLPPPVEKAPKEEPGIVPQAASWVDEPIAEPEVEAEAKKTDGATASGRRGARKSAR